MATNARGHPVKRIEFHGNARLEKGEVVLLLQGCECEKALAVFLPPTPTHWLLGCRARGLLVGLPLLINAVATTTGSVTTHCPSN